MSIVEIRPNHSAEAVFRDTVGDHVAAFKAAGLVKRVERDDVSLTHYHAILTTLFHQTRSSPFTFAEAAANCDWRHEAAKEYLLQHAEEERTHWRWVLNDLRNSGYDGPDPRSLFPHPTCEAYISFNERVAKRMPVARLAIACVLEGIGAAFGEQYGRRLLQSLKLRPDQGSFFLSHGETDKQHIEEVWEVIARCDLRPEEWSWMNHAAAVAGHLYCAMYSHEAFA